MKLILISLLSISAIFAQNVTTEVFQAELSNIRFQPIMEDGKRVGLSATAECGGQVVEVSENSRTGSFNMNMLRSNIRLSLARKCSELNDPNPGSNSVPNPMEEVANEISGGLEEVEEIPNGACVWLDGKKLIGTATANAIACQSKVCGGEVICKTEGGFEKKVASCVPKGNKCPTANECLDQNIVREVLDEDKYDLKWDGYEDKSSVQN